MMKMIVILVVIAFIATSWIINVINDGKQGSTKDSVYVIIQVRELKFTREHMKSNFFLPHLYQLVFDFT